jgi:hypothetical protein
MYSEAVTVTAPIGWRRTVLMENPMDAKSNCYRREEPGLAVKPGINRVEKMSDAKLLGTSHRNTSGRYLYQMQRLMPFLFRIDV